MAEGAVHVRGDPDAGAEELLLQHVIFLAGPEAAQEGNHTEARRRGGDSQISSLRGSVPACEEFQLRRLDGRRRLCGSPSTPAGAPEAADRRGTEGCGPAAPIVLQRADTCVNGTPYADYARLEIEVDPALAARGFPFPRADSHTITERDFPFIIEHIRAQNGREFGPDADRPD